MKTQPSGLRQWLRRLLTAALVLAAVYIALLLVAPLLGGQAPSSPFNRPGRYGPLLIAHQGGAGVWPPETTYAYQHSVELGADVLDMDIHLTKDGVIVLNHDVTVDRTTDGAGLVKDMTAAQVLALDAGYRFTTDGGRTFPYRGQGLRLSTLEELFQAYPDDRMNVEIKQSDPPMIAPFCAMIHQYHMQDKVMTGGFDAATVENFRHACPDVATTMTETEGYYLLGLSWVRLTRLLHPAYTSVQVPEERFLPQVNSTVTVLSPEFIAATHDLGAVVYPWTINDKPTMQRLLDWGADGINTDRPDLLLEVLQARRP
jgi:glycerophosphoryl diester phosphodiesterase